MPVQTPPSIRRIDADRDDAYAFEVTGHITSADIENLYGLLEAGYALHDKIDLLVLVHDYEGFDWSAAFTETTMVGKTHALKHIRRYAVVGGPGWMAAAINVSKPFLSLEMKHFEPDRVQDAWEWIGAMPVDPG